MRAAAQQAARTRPCMDWWAEHVSKMQQHFQLGGLAKHIVADDMRHALHENQGLADQRFVDGGDILRHPILRPSNLHAFNAAHDKIGAEQSL